MTPPQNFLTSWPIYLRRSVLVKIADIYLHLQEWQKVIEFCNQALFIARKIDNKNLITSSLHILGQSYQKLDQYHKAIDFWFLRRFYGN
ncbi:MAG: tetratricopeptide repeat protein [Gloeotrichia echinulata GP01]